MRFPCFWRRCFCCFFGVFGSRLASIERLSVPTTVMLLCFIMGLQNAVISKLSESEIRTTHITGTVTDVGIELGRVLYRNAAGTLPQDRVVASWNKLRFLGGVAGALRFEHLGYISTAPLAMLLVVLAVVPAIDDVVATFGRWIRK